MHARGGGLTVQLCGDSNVACKWMNGEYAQGTNYKNWENSKNLALMVEERSCHTDLSQRQLRETHLQGHNQEADHWADIGAQGRKKLISTGKTHPQHGKRYEASGMEVSKTMARAAAES